MGIKKMKNELILLIKLILYKKCLVYTNYKIIIVIAIFRYII